MSSPWDNLKLEYDGFGRYFRSIGKPIVFTNGCFDILHPGHLRVLSFCQQIAFARSGIVVVGLNSDASVRRLKGPDRPIFSDNDRHYMLSMLRTVHQVIIFDEDTPWNLINAIRPQVIVKGGDYKKEDVVGSDLVDEVMIVPHDGQSTTKILEKLRG